MAYLQGRFRKARPGSVLILVVALLVMLALIGTAFISSTRIDRFSSAQHTSNTQADLLIEGLVNITQANISAALFGTDDTGSLRFRPPAVVGLAAPLTSPTIYNNFDSAQTNMFLGDRVPVAGTNALLPLQMWSSVSWPLTSDSTGNYNADSPFENSTPLGVLAIKKTMQAYPYFKSIGGQTVPGLVFYDSPATGPKTYHTPAGLQIVNPSATTANSYVTVAGDTDGDGVPDAPLFKLPVGEIGGITYYGAVRIVDNNAAINVNTAMSNASDYLAMDGNFCDAIGVAVTPPAVVNNLGTFPSSVGLAQMLVNYITPTSSMPFGTTDMDKVATYVRGGNAIGTDVSVPVDDSTAARPDFTFLTNGEALASQLTRRMAFPSLIFPGPATQTYAAYSSNDGAALAYRFCIKNPQSSTGQLETDLFSSVVNGVPTTPYSLSTQSINAWYTNNFNFAVQNTKPVRSLLVTGNPTSDLIPSHGVTNAGTFEPPNPGMMPYAPALWTMAKNYVPGDFVIYAASATVPARCFQAIAPVPPSTVPSAATAASWREEKSWTQVPNKTSINTADFPALWRAFYNVMADKGDSIPPLPGGTVLIPYANAGWGPFRDASRSVTPNLLTSGEMLQIRSAIAAVNAMDTRDSDDDVTSRRIVVYSDAAHLVPAFDVTVFGVEKQPFITTVVADSDGTNGTALSIELYNPTDTVMDLTNWQIGLIDRITASGIITLPSPGIPIPPGTMIQPGGYLILQDGTANMMPNAALVPPQPAAVPVMGMAIAATPAAPREVVLMRPRRADTGAAANPLTASVAFDNIFDEGAPPAANPTIDQLVPVDQIDLTGVFQAGTPGRRVYERPNGPDPSAIPVNSGYNWKFVYPGAYATVPPANTPNQTGWGALANPAPAPPVSATQSDGTLKGGLNNTNSFPPIQLATTDWVGPHNTSTYVPVTNLAQFPFGGFARNGDMLKVPYIGAYIVRTFAVPPNPPSNPSGTPAAIVALNSLPADASMADAQLLPAQQQDEAIGRFCPMAALNPSAIPSYANTAAAPNTDPYGWAAKIFDYLDVQVASNDYLPNVDPALSDVTAPVNPRNAKYTNTLVPAAAPTVAKNLSTTANGTGEQTVGKQGLINVNTAPAYVLQRLPGVSAAMANAIVVDRTANGPFKTIFDLNRVGAVSPPTVPPPVSEFQTQGGLISLYTSPTQRDYNLATDPGVANGDFTPSVATYPQTPAQTDGVRNDFEERLLMLTKISNLITTRSDSFTCYVLLQGWRSVGTSAPSLAVQRRAAFLFDRSVVTPTSTSGVAFKVLTN